MFTTIYRLKFPELVDSPVLKDLIRSFGIHNPVPRRSHPAWDVNVVLRSLLVAPYEPLGGAPLRTLTMKTLFLLALATAKRVGEI